MLVNRHTLPSKRVARRGLHVILMICVSCVLLLNSLSWLSEQGDYANLNSDAVSTLRQSTAPRRHLKSLGNDDNTARFTKRQLFEQGHSVTDSVLMFQALKHSRNPRGEPRQRKDVPYDIFNCPMEPPTGYPFAWNVVDVLEHWNVQDIETPRRNSFHHGLCVFDWLTQQEEVMVYRLRELPFILKNHPDVFKTAERWMTPGYLDDLLGDEAMPTDTSNSSYFAFAQPGLGSTGSQQVEMTYPDFLAKSQAMDNYVASRKDGSKAQAHLDHQYFRVNGHRQTGHNSFLYDELNYFDDTNEDSFFVVETGQDLGIHCRFGMAGVTVPMHFDNDRNFIAVLGGKRRFLLAHPDQCEGMELYGDNHPSARHSSKWDWANVSFSTENTLPNAFRKAKVNEVVLQAGDVMYLPSFWMHMPISLGLNYQCNARSGASFEYRAPIEACGFPSK